MAKRKTVVTAARLSALAERRQFALELGVRLRLARLAVGMSQTEASAASGVLQSTISDVENAVSTPTLFVLCDLAATYRTTVGALIDEP